MIGLKLDNHYYFNEAADIIRMYFGKCDIEKCNEALADSQSFLKEYEAFVISSLQAAEGNCVCTSRYMDGQRQEEVEVKSSTELPSEKVLKRLVKKSMYKLLSKVFGREYPWGILTGIRPVKIVHELMDIGLPEADITCRLMEEYYMSEDRAKLAVEIASIERPFVYPPDEKSVSIYIGIPFCPSRCHYCSFTSNSIKTYHAYVEPYLASLEEEISRVSQYLDNKGYSVQTIYIGGGTPTALNAQQLERLLKFIGQCFGWQVAEFTCEAGRPDSITEEKLKVLIENNVGRISINPQTMNDATLECIGRAHTSEHVLHSFNLARKIGFKNINMDLILGLPGENMEHLVRTLEEIKKLDPESVTVHTMSLKRASLYSEGFMKGLLLEEENVSLMMEYSKEFLRGMGMHPYYLYRQKHMLQNLENIGFSKKGFECIYNMQMIEDKQTIVAFGADAVTKVVAEGDRIERQHNIKDVKLYIEKIEEMISRKLDILEQLGKTY